MKDRTNACNRIPMKQIVPYLYMYVSAYYSHNIIIRVTVNLFIFEIHSGKQSFPVNLDCWLCSRDHISEFTRELQEIGVQYVGLCCGNRSNNIRTMAEALGRSPPASKYSPDMSQHLSRIQDDQHDYTHSTYHKRFTSA